MGASLGAICHGQFAIKSYFGCFIVMQIELKSLLLNEHIKDQAEIQGKTPDQLVERVLIRCMELKLIERMQYTTNNEEWANGPIE